MTSPDVRIRCWGTRGSIPTPGPETAGYGGNTSCFEVRAGEERIIFDAGTGLRPLGAKLVAEEEPSRALIFLTHFHWDHIQGFPFFLPLFTPGWRMEIVGPQQQIGDRTVDVKTLFAGQMGPVYFPVPFETVSSEINFSHMNEGDWQEGVFDITAMRMRHPSFTVGYKIRVGNRCLCYIPDNEVAGGQYDVGPDWHERLVDFISGVDLLIHDAMFTEDEYTAREGWGHSTFRQALDLALEGRVKRLMFFHHAPERSDAELNRILARYREEAAHRALDVRVDAAFEGKQIDLEETDL